MTSTPDNTGDGRRPKSYVVRLSDDGQLELPKELLQKLEDSGYDARPGTTVSLVAEGHNEQIQTAKHQPSNAPRRCREGA